MKKNSFFYAMTAAATLLGVSACSSENGTFTEEPAGAEDQVINIAVANDNSLSSRAGRPLEGSQPGQQIDIVKVVLTNSSDQVVWTKDVAWSAAQDYANGKKLTVVIPKTGADSYDLQDGDYKVYAYGYANESDYTGLTDIPGTGEFKGDVVVTSQNLTGEEIFAGDKSFTWSDAEGADHNIALVLNRQVAGTFGYFSTIPYVVDEEGTPGQYLHLVASNPKKSIVLGNFSNADHANLASQMFVNNGVGEAPESKILYTINLNDWFSAITEKTEVVDGITVYKGVLDNSKWLAGGSDAETAKSKKFKKGSVFAGVFVNPFGKLNDGPVANSTLTLVLSTNDNLTGKVREWTITLPNGADQLSEHDLFSASAAEGAYTWASAKATDTRSVYSILRNRLYTIGKRWNNDDHYNEGGTDPDPDPTPDPEHPDEPTPLNNTQELQLLVNHNWEAIYSMGIE